jgi:hypothetical protein
VARKFLQSLFSSDDKAEAEKAMHKMAKKLKDTGEANTHGVKVVHRSGTWQVDLYGDEQ